MSFSVAYIPIGVPTFHLESAQIQFDNSIKLLKSLTNSLVYPDKMLLSIDDLSEFLDSISPDLIVLQNITFANAAYATEVLRRFDCPLLLWTLREPIIDGGRLRLNSLTGAYSAANALHAFGRTGFSYIFGSPEEDDTIASLKANIQAAEVKSKLRHTKIAAIGHTPQGFGFGRALDSELAVNFGITLESIEARELIDKAKSYTAEECAPWLQKADLSVTGLSEMPLQNQTDFSRLYKAYSSYVEENKIDAIASRCWPDFFTAYGTPVCMVLSLLNDSGTASSCESDIYGAVSMLIGKQLTGKPTFFGDPVSLDEQDNSITYWHCGMASCSLAREDTGAAVGVHPNRKIGPVMDFGCRQCDDVTIFRIGRKPDATFRMFIAEGSAMDKPKQFCGTSVVVKTKANSRDVVEQSVKDGWEPHFVVIYGAVKKELMALGNMLDIEICCYDNN